MIRTLTALFGLLLLSIACTTSRVGAAFQEFSYTSPKGGFSVEFPSPVWKKIGEPDDVHQHTEFIYGERSDGYLRIRKETLDQGVSIQEFARRDQDERTRFQPGFVDGKSETFNGRLDGVTASYEFTQGGKPMAGRNYYLKIDDHSVYVLRFTGSRDKFLRIRNQTDFIARSLKLK
ncbi:MAG TPA: hypothetical protein VE863_07250 [Pyrinomonadaceae bacterium]|jgi:hypothetical protein|nr:hypothetical protein [Pyrinomonadaceae bacterium]